MGSNESFKCGKGSGYLQSYWETNKQRSPSSLSSTAGALLSSVWWRTPHGKHLEESLTRGRHLVAYFLAFKTGLMQILHTYKGCLLRVSALWAAGIQPSEGPFIHAWGTDYRFEGLVLHVSGFSHPLTWPSASSLSREVWSLQTACVLCVLWLDTRVTLDSVSWSCDFHYVTWTTWMLSFFSSSIQWTFWSYINQHSDIIVFWAIAMTLLKLSLAPYNCLQPARFAVTVTNAAQMHFFSSLLQFERGLLRCSVAKDNCEPLILLSPLLELCG